MKFKPHMPHLDGHRMWLETERAGHLMYYALVYLEAHSHYAYPAGFLFVLTIIGFLKNMEE